MENFILFTIGILVGGVTMAASVAFLDLSNKQSSPGILPGKIPSIERHYFYPPPIQIPCPEKRVS